MEWYAWAIIGLLVLSYYQYANPEAANKLVEPLWGRVKDFLSSKLPSAESTKDSVCADVPDNPVCADGETFRNMCEAAFADKLQATPGAC